MPMLGTKRRPMTSARRALTPIAEALVVAGLMAVAYGALIIGWALS